MKFRLVFLLSLLALSAACSANPSPVSPTSVSLPPAATPDAAATELAITQKIFATLTASAPQSTVTPPPGPDNPTPKPTVVAPTLSLQLSPSVTPILALPTAVPTRSGAVVSTEPTQAPPPAVSAEGLRGKILFKSTRAGGKYPGSFNWFAMDADGKNVTQLPKDAAAAFAQEQLSNAGYSPDRSFLVVGESSCGNGHCDLYIAPPELAVTRSQGQWTSGPNYARADQPVWSPDGNWIAFTWNRDNDRTKNIFKGQPFEQNQDFKRLTDFGGHRDTKSPTYSPDGALLAFATQDGAVWQIWTLNALAENFTDAAAHSIGTGEADDWDPIWVR